jgi:hypothetical protein
VAIDQVWWLQQVRLRLLACRLVTSIHLNRIARLISGSESLNDRHGPKTNREGQMTGVDTYRVATPIIGRHLSPMIHLQNQASPGAQTLIDLADQTKNPKNRALHPQPRQSPREPAARLA